MQKVYFYLVRSRYLLAGIFTVSFMLSFHTLADSSVPPEVVMLMDKISEVNLNVVIDEQETLHKAILTEAEAYLDKHKDQAEAWVVVALSRSSYARSQGMGALGLMKQVRKELEKAMEIDKAVMGGYAQSFLGRVYFSLPAWPVSYGSDKKARGYLEESLSINNQSMENHFYYGNFLSSQKQYKLALEHLQKAKTAVPIVDSPNWVANMNKQIDEILVYVEGKINK